MKSYRHNATKNSSAESDIKWTLCGKKFWTGCNQDSNGDNSVGKDGELKLYYLFIFCCCSCDDVLICIEV